METRKIISTYNGISKIDCKIRASPKKYNDEKNMEMTIKYRKILRTDKSNAVQKCVSIKN